MGTVLNPPYQELLPDRELLGRPIFEALPEIKDQPVGAIFRQVYETGQPYDSRELLIATEVPGQAGLV